MDLTICPNTLCGHIEAPASKSELHRAFICAALSDGVTEVRCGELCDDVAATVRCLRALGAEIDLSEGVCTVSGGISSDFGREDLDCRESGTTLRLLVPLLWRGGRRFSRVRRTFSTRSRRRNG